MRFLKEYLRYRNHLVGRRIFGLCQRVALCGSVCHRIDTTERGVRIFMLLELRIFWRSWPYCWGIFTLYLVCLLSDSASGDIPRIVPLFKAKPNGELSVFFLVSVFAISYLYGPQHAYSTTKLIRIAIRFVMSLGLCFIINRRILGRNWLICLHWRVLSLSPA